MPCHGTFDIGTGMSGGDDVLFGKTRLVEEPSLYAIIYEYITEQVYYMWSGGGSNSDRLRPG